jgi:hypothetical protein|tara:strand:+ start:1174 stop:1395 length:222 start_codon:yes stop_codon:yes gene_type:complete
MKMKFSDEPLMKVRKNDDAIALLVDGKTLLDLTKTKASAIRSTVYKIYGKGHAISRKQTNGLFSIGLTDKPRD